MILVQCCPDGRCSHKKKLPWGGYECFLEYLKLSPVCPMTIKSSYLPVPLPLVFPRPSPPPPLFPTLSLALFFCRAIHSESLKQANSGFRSYSSLFSPFICRLCPCWFLPLCFLFPKFCATYKIKFYFSWFPRPMDSCFRPYISHLLPSSAPGFFFFFEID